MTRFAKFLFVACLRPAAQAAQWSGRIRRAWAHARLQAGIESQLDASVVVLGVPEVHGTGRIELGANLFLYSQLHLETQNEGRISIGSDVVLSRGVHVVSFASVEIGCGSMVGEYASIRDANHLFGGDRSIRTAGHQARPVRIGQNVWIGRGVCVLPGVTIGDGAVVGANAVVTRDVHPGAVVAGAPARELQSRAAA